MTVLRIFLVLVASAILGCGQPDEQFREDSIENLLLKKSIEADYKRFEGYYSFFRVKTNPVELMQSRFRTLRHLASEPPVKLLEELDSLSVFVNQITPYPEENKTYYNLKLTELRLAIENGKTGTTKYQNDLMEFEKLMLYTFYDRISWGNIAELDSFGIMAIAESNVIRLGDTYKANIYMTAYQTSNPSDIYVYQSVDCGVDGIGPLDTIHVIRGINPLYQFSPDSIGNYSYCLIWEHKTNTGNTLKWSTTETFQVIK